MTAVVADSHAIVWFLKNSNQLSDHAATAMDSAIQDRHPLCKG